MSGEVVEAEPVTEQFDFWDIHQLILDSIKHRSQDARAYVTALENVENCFW